MLKANVVFLKDEFFDKYGKENNLPMNKEIADGQQHSRPCFFVFDDRKDSRLMWCVPISSRVDKYETLRQHKIEKLKARGATKPICREIYIGNLLYSKRAYLIQNMFPITEKYIDGYYIDKQTGKPAVVDDLTAKHVIENATIQLRKYMGGNDKAIYTNAKAMCKSLLDELTQERAEQTAPVGEMKLNYPYPAPSKMPTEAERRIPFKDLPPDKERLTMAEWKTAIATEREKAIKSRKNAEQKEATMPSKESREMTKE